MSELEDFEAFLGDEFDQTRFAASLLQATNVVDDTELDLSTPLKKLKFDVNECNKRMESLASAHHNQLLRNIDKVEVNRKLMNDIITPLTARLKSAYERISKDVISPYDDAVKLNKALQKIHQTSKLLRGTSFFVVLLQQLHECEKSVQLSEESKEVVRLAKNYTQIASFFKNPEDVAKDSSTDLLSIKLIRDYSPLFQVKSAEFIAGLEEKISNDLGHHSSFNANNSSLQNNVLALYVMAPQQLSSLIDRSAMTKSIQIALAQLTRSLQSPRTLASAFAEIKQSASNFSSTLSALFINCDALEAVGDMEPLSLLNNFILSLPDAHGSSIEDIYWSRLAYKFKKSVAATMARGGPIARNLKSQHTVLLNSVDSALEGTTAEMIKDALSLIGSQN
ncbi:hypothetical protein METBIDRAFT_46973 [Metschnikowia bicuspidata var. bicuspidata NRRL YB-4993]|uniref:Conserved oligomeric Golgi complex subunit 5 n=1 Tax=Metschnikowia bicuspidata var. bicuspidata NRRL YB-4993 TaxID=869754 RepID=A0A1A0H5V4_9ASCO|nr:hypothetical protein METBIDRAFT_46973 [Metschnikowia bicuspidata var. bicuspidata NRRL YB-4993]OBA19287.1 hypothetical protein METBIDRAFT_46973 [Metschnikowia bicuspidata var. bicuspidata NRRL YB-4993]